MQDFNACKTNDSSLFKTSQSGFVLSGGSILMWSNPPFIISFILQATNEFPFPLTAWDPPISTMDLSDKIRNVIAPLARRGEKAPRFGFCQSLFNACELSSEVCVLSINVLVYLDVPFRMVSLSRR